MSNPTASVKTASPTAVVLPAVAALAAAKALLKPFRLGDAPLPLPIADLPRHPDNRPYNEVYAAELAKSLQDRLDVRKHPCQVIVRLKVGCGVEKQTTREAFYVSALENRKSFQFKDATPMSTDDLDWLFDNFEVSPTAMF